MTGWMPRMTTTLAVLAAVVLAWWSLDTRAEYVANSTQLKDLQSFEVETFHETFDLERQHVDPELLEYAQTAVYENNVLPMASPAQGIIHLDCSGHAFGYGCGYIHAKVTVGKAGPLVWERKFPNYWFYSLKKDPRRMAQSIVNAIARDYQTVPAQTGSH